VEQAERDAEHFENWSPHYITHMGTFTDIPFIAMIVGWLLLSGISLVILSSFIIGPVAFVIGAIVLPILVIAIAIHQVLTNPPITPLDLEELFE
jgi:hypothetical protein